MKSSFKLLILFLSGWFLTACETDSCGCIVMDVGIEVAIADSEGNDLLDPSIEGYFSEQDINMYYEINGKLKTHASMSSGHLDDPDGFSIEQHENRYILFLSSNPTAGKKVVTILRIKDHPDIKLVTTVNGENGKRIEKIWYNDQLVWPVSGQGDYRRVTITLD